MQFLYSFWLIKLIVRFYFAYLKIVLACKHVREWILKSFILRQTLACVIWKRWILVVSFPLAILLESAVIAVLILITSLDLRHSIFMLCLIFYLFKITDLFLIWMQESIQNIKMIKNKNFHFIKYFNILF